MPINIEMPKLSDTMTEGTLVKWHKQAGDEVEIGDILAEIETDKATMEMEAFDEGTLAKIIVEEGSKCPVGEVMAILAEEDEEVDAAADGGGSSDSSEQKEKSSDDDGEKEASSESQASSESSSDSSDSGAADGGGSQTTADGERIKASPLARKIAEDKGVDLSSIEGSGPGGRIVKDDVENAKSGSGGSSSGGSKSSGSGSSSSSSAASGGGGTMAKAVQPVVGDDDEVQPLSNLRKIIADRLLASKQTVPHFYLHVEVDAGPMMTTRKQINAQAEETHGNKFTFNDFVMKAMINACQTVPAVNSAYSEDGIVRFGNVGVAVAIAIEDGLVTPVVKKAQDKTLLTISKEVKEMAKRAKEGKLKPNEYDGGTITISNLGAWGIESFDAIVNPPQAAIVSVGGIIEKAVSVNGEIKSGMRMNLGLSCDHRVVDGAVAATYLNEVKKLLENPALMLV